MHPRKIAPLKIKQLIYCISNFGSLTDSLLHYNYETTTQKFRYYYGNISREPGLALRSYLSPRKIHFYSASPFSNQFNNIAMLKTTLLSAAIFCAALAQAQQHFSLSMPSLKCRKTTESGQDEIYLYVVYHKSDGVKSGLRLPIIPKTSIDMNDRVVLENDINWGELLPFDLKPGERIDIAVNILEQDDGTIPQYAVFPTLLKDDPNFFNALANGRTPTFQIIPTILGRIAGSAKLKDSDDWIGTFTVSVELTSTGTVKREYRGIFNTNDEHRKLPSPAKDTNKATYEFGGDGSFYIAKILLAQSVIRNR